MSQDASSDLLDQSHGSPTIYQFVKHSTLLGDIIYQISLILTWVAINGNPSVSLPDAKEFYFFMLMYLIFTFWKILLAGGVTPALKNQSFNRKPVWGTLVSTPVSKLQYEI